jgi:hypothetical protein
LWVFQEPIGITVPTLRKMCDLMGCGDPTYYGRDAYASPNNNDFRMWDPGKNQFVVVSAPSLKNRRWSCSGTGPMIRCSAPGTIVPQPWNEFSCINNKVPKGLNLYLGGADFP